jgi:hypothetical protein
VRAADTPLGETKPMLLVNSLILGDDRGRGRSREIEDLTVGIRVGIPIQDPSILTSCPMARVKMRMMMLTKKRMIMISGRVAVGLSKGCLLYRSEVSQECVCFLCSISDRN